MNSEFGKTIQRLIDENLGDQHRLEDMQSRITLGRKLYNSDILYLEKLTELLDEPVVFGEEPFVFEKETKVQVAKGIVKQTVGHTVEQTVEHTRLITKQRIPIKLIIILSSIIAVSALGFLAIYFNLDFLPDILIYNELHDLFFANIVLPVCEMELYWNPCQIFD